MKKLILLAFLLFCTIAHAQPQKCCKDFTNEEAVEQILFYAADEDDSAMMAIACAMRNRTSILGIALHGDISNVPKDIQARAWKVWEDSETGPDVVDGAETWEESDENGGQIRPPSKNIGYTPDQEYADKYKKRVKGTPTKKFGRHQFYRLGQ